MANLFEMFKLSKTLEMADGDLKLMGLDINIIPTSILADIQKGLIDSLGFAKAYDMLYTKAKKGSLEYNTNFIKKQNFTDKHKIGRAHV